MGKKEFMEQQKQNLIEFMKELVKQKGYECYVINDDPDPCNYAVYGFIITENNYIVGIQREQNYFNGWSTSLQYKPSQDNGSGCMGLNEVSDNDIKNLNIYIIDQSIKESLNFIRTKGSKPNFYKDGNEYIRNLWNMENYIKI